MRISGLVQQKIADRKVAPIFSGLEGAPAVGGNKIASVFCFLEVESLMSSPRKGVTGTDDLDNGTNYNNDCVWIGNKPGFLGDVSAHC